MENPFEIIVYDKYLQFVGFVVDPIYSHFVPSWWNQGYGSFMLADDNPHSAALQAKGARVTVSYRGENLMSGPIRSRRGNLTKSGSVIYQVLDDHRLLRNTIAFVRPDLPLETTSLSSLGQTSRPGGDAGTPGIVTGQYSYFAWPKYPVGESPGSPGTPMPIMTAEDAVKHIIRVNLVERLGRNITILPTQKRGGDAQDYLPIVRMESLSEAIQPILNRSGLAVKMWQDPYGDTIFCDVVEPGEWDQELTPEADIVRDGMYAVEAPEITRAIMGGSHETAKRAFSGIQGSGNQTPLEEAYNDVIEVFREAPAFEYDWPAGLPDEQKVAKYFQWIVGVTETSKENYAEFWARFQAESLAEGPETSTLELALSETETFHFGGADGIQLGDFITVKTSGVLFRNQVTECMLTFTRDAGVKVTPLIGQREDDPDRVLAKAIADVARALRNISTRK